MVSVKFYWLKRKFFGVEDFSKLSVGVGEDISLEVKIVKDVGRER